MGSRRVGDHGLRQRALESTAAIDLEAPLVEVAQEDGEPECEQAAHHQQSADGEDHQALIGHVRRSSDDGRRRFLTPRCPTSIYVSITLASADVEAAPDSWIIVQTVI